MSKTPPVFWSEGMFLRPHHLQAAERYREELLATEIRRIQPYSWGVTAIDIALDQLENFTLELREAEIKLKDGTVLSLGSNLRLSPQGFRQELDQAGGRMKVWLGVPNWRHAQPNAFLPGERVGGSDRRFTADLADVMDENVGANPQPVEVKRYNGRFFFGAENRDGYECVPIAFVERSGQGKNHPVLSRDFIPPVTEIGAWRVLQILCDSITNRIEAKHRILLSELASGRLTMDSEGTAGWQTIIKLQILGSYKFLMQQLTRLQRIHPFDVYKEFSRLAGELSIFDDGKKALEIPLYDHENLGPCFYETCRIIEMLLEKIIASRFVKVDFVFREVLTFEKETQKAEKYDLFSVDLLPEWLAPEVKVYFCIETEMKKQDLEVAFRTMKLGALRDIPVLRIRRLIGLLEIDAEPETRAPAGLPTHENYYYYAIEKEADNPYWVNVTKDRNMALAVKDTAAKTKFALYILNKPGSMNG